MEKLRDPQNGCPWDKNTYINAIKYNHLDCAQWAKDNGCPTE